MSRRILKRYGIAEFAKQEDKIWRVFCWHREARQSVLIQIADTVNMSIDDITREVAKGVFCAMETGNWEHSTFRIF